MRTKKIFYNEKISKKNISYVLFALSLVLIIVLTFIFFNLESKQPMHIEEYEVFFTVMPGRAGFDINDTALTFGIIPPDGEGKRKIKIRNNYDFPILVNARISESLIGFIDSESEFVLGVDEEKELEVSVIVPLGTEEKDYDGKLRLEFYKI